MPSENCTVCFPTWTARRPPDLRHSLAAIEFPKTDNRRIAVDDDSRNWIFCVLQKSRFPIYAGLTTNLAPLGA